MIMPRINPRPRTALTNSLANQNTIDSYRSTFILFSQVAPLVLQVSSLENIDKSVESVQGKIKPGGFGCSSRAGQLGGGVIYAFAPFLAPSRF